MSESFFRKDGTAQGVAKQRYIESIAKPAKRVIYDPFAALFIAGAGVIKFMGHKLNVWLSSKLAPGFHEHLISRTRFIDDYVEKVSAEGVEQYVILGAGYDSRAHRLQLSSTMKIYEVDQQEVQDRKRAKLPKDAPNQKNVTYVSVDFNQQTLTEELLQAGFDPNKPTVFTLEGVSQYISKEALQATIHEVSELGKRTKIALYLSFANKNLKTNPTACFGKGYKNPEKKAELVMGLSAKVGEPWIGLYSNEEMKEILLSAGLTIEENKTLEDLNPLYFGPVGRLLPENEIFKLEHSVIAKNGNQ